MAKVDLRKQWSEFYPRKGGLQLLTVPSRAYLTLAGAGSPSGPAFKEAVGALYATSYTLKFMLKARPGFSDWTVMPLEGMWSVPEGTTLADDGSNWHWTAMIVQPDFVTDELAAEAIAAARAKKGSAPALADVRFARWEDGLALQTVYVGPYAGEAPVLEGMHRWAREHGYASRGWHREIYLNDPRRVAPEKLTTILRLPLAATG